MFFLPSSEMVLSAFLQLLIAREKLLIVSNDI